MSALRSALTKLVNGLGLSAEEAGEALKEVVSGDSSQALVAAFLTAMRLRGEGEEELYGMARMMKGLCVRVEIRDPESALDVVGTGGDRVKTINVSTLSSMVVAAAGVRVAKHGNRAATGVCGSADLLEGLGVNIGAGPEVVKRCVDECGFGFMFAPIYHPAMRSVAGVRRELGFRTFFNLLGPATNPAGVGRMLLGVSEPPLIERMAMVLQRLGLRRGLVVSSRQGLDEISVQGETEAVWIEGGEVWREAFRPADFGIEPLSLEPTVVRSRDEALESAVKILSGKLNRRDPRMAIVLVNSAAALTVAGACSGLREGVEIAENVIASGKALETVERVVEVSGGDLERLGEVVKRFT